MQTVGQWVGWRAQDGRWEKETEMSKSLRDTDEQTTYDLLWLFAGSSSFHLVSLHMVTQV